MPKQNKRIAANSLISVSSHYLRKTEARELLKGRFDFNAPGLRFYGTVISTNPGANDKVICEVRLDECPDHTFTLFGSSLKFEGPRVVPTVVTTTTAVEEEEEEEDLQVSEEEEEDDIRPVNQDDWIMGDVTMDSRLTSGKDYHSNKATFNLSNKLTASPADYFLYFLPVEFISDVVIHNINQHALSIMNTWISVTFVEYLTWIALLMNMTVMHHVDKRAYWHMGSSHLMPNINFTEYMEYDRFFAILRVHVFEVPSGAQQLLDPLYQIRRFLDAFNKTLAKALTPGRYLCVDESMNQWLGSGMPNLKKVPRKPHPIGQEFKTLADHDTYCIVQLDTVSDPAKKKYDDVDRNLIATLKRLCEPWFFSGRTIIGDSWFGSPEMTCVLLDHGLHSIMQVAKRMYWPRGMPRNDIIQCLRTERGSYVAMSKSDHNGHNIFACAFKDKKAKVLVSSCSTSMPSNVPHTYKGSNGQSVTMTRPQVFHDYESHKSSVDANNNRRDNMISFHDIMKTYRWEVRFLSFVFGIAEANAFSCFKIWGCNRDGLVHSDFKSRLAHSLLVKVKSMKHTVQVTEAEPMHTRSSYAEGSHAYVALGSMLKRKRQTCKFCEQRGFKPERVSKRCACNDKAMCSKCHIYHFAEDLNKKRHT
ncbi:hypothetical protein INT47_006348 [Mucor saturninus]|uniref:PiggyBac transposable element-derived protein domain-containing protein n=1 Tax=Mucor saturninus TaxID=64648 RepID=A0A8H7RKC4_9FUNG|nr:hypothetical protein INT47_006348 [Mucor saturninus]